MQKAMVDTAAYALARFEKGSTGHNAATQALSMANNAYGECTQKVQQTVVTVIGISAFATAVYFLMRK